MADYQVTCITKNPRFDRHHAIQNIGGVLSNGQTWKIAQQEAVTFIDTHQHTFFVAVRGRRANVITEPSQFVRGLRYLKTDADGVLADNLLSLPPCP